MVLNPEIFDVLKEFKIKRDEGILCLLGLYFELDVESTCSEETVNLINLTKIVVKDYRDNSLTWNMPLFEGQDTEFGWVSDWLQPFGRINPDRKGSPRDATTRMKDFFKKYPEYRKSDVYLARDMYLITIKDPKFLMKSHKFIFDGAGAMKKSTLLEFCEKAKQNSENRNLKGTVIS